MLFVQKRRRNDCSHPFTLFESSYAVATDLYTIWDKVGNAFYGKRCPFKLTWMLSWEEEKENLEGCSFVLSLDYFEWKK